MYSARAGGKWGNNNKKFKVITTTVDINIKKKNEQAGTQ